MNSLSVCPTCLESWPDSMFNLDGYCPSCADAALLTLLLDQHGVDIAWVVKHNLLSEWQAQLVDYNILSLSLFVD